MNSTAFAPASNGEETRSTSEGLSVGEVVFLVVALASWTLLLAVGIFVSSGPYRDTLLKGQTTPLNFVIAFLMAISTYTFTNLAALCGLASFVGAGARRIEAQLSDRTPVTKVRVLYSSAAIRGFVVYLTALSGLMFFVESDFTGAAVSADRYIRLAGTLSLLSFMIGFSPEMFARFLDRIARLLEDRAEKAPVRN